MPARKTLSLWRDESLHSISLAYILARCMFVGSWLPPTGVSSGGQGGGSFLEVLFSVSLSVIHRLGRPSPPFLPNFINSPSSRSGLVQTKPDVVSPEALTGQSSPLKTLDLTGPGPDRPGLDWSGVDHSEHWLAERAGEET